MSDRFINKVIADKYRIESYLGESRSGQLYRGTHLLIGSSVTVKILERGDVVDESAAAGFSAEAREVSKVAHPNVLNITDFGQDVDGTIFAVLEDPTGETLGQRIADEGQMMTTSAVRIVRQVLSALSAARSKGLAHGSLTSGKVLMVRVGDTGEIVKVFDIGAYNTIPRNSETPLDPEEMAYMAPELFIFRAKPDERSDVYSLGILLYEMLAGEKPFSGETENEMLQRHSQVPPPPLSAFREDVPEALESALIGALAKDPAKRYATFEEFGEALNLATGDEGITENIVTPAAVQENNNVWKTAFIVLAGISVMALGLVLWTNSGQQDPGTVLRTDKDSQPVQPLNPATGITERTGLDAAPKVLSGDPEALPEEQGGDGYDPWANPGSPPAGAPTPIGPGGDYVTVPENGSVFMPGDSGVVLVPKVVTPTPTPSSSPSPTPASPENSNTQNPKPSASPAPTKEAKPTPAKKPSSTPSAKVRKAPDGDAGKDSTSSSSN